MDRRSDKCLQLGMPVYKSIIWDSSVFRGICAVTQSRSISHRVEHIMIANDSLERKCTFQAYLLIDETLGTVSLSQTASANSLSLISHANMVGFCLL